ncbi:MAG: winged helix-turn-helix domain-containing protein [Candidatus Wallbacteria bacterium]|nr:winged helix-turn-helix domain-containing protein [Candidatus Wallbacteria bacterium]
MSVSRIERVGAGRTARRSSPPGAGFETGGTTEASEWLRGLEQLAAAPFPAGRPALPAVELVGRVAERERLGSELAHGKVVQIGGLPGSGKTRLADELSGAWTAGPVVRVTPEEAAEGLAVDRAVLAVVDGLDRLPLAQARRALELLASRSGPALVTSRTRPVAYIHGLVQLPLAGLLPDDATTLARTSFEASGIEWPGHEPSDLSGSSAGASGPLEGHPLAVLCRSALLAEGRAADPAELARLALPELSSVPALAILCVMAAAEIPLRRDWLELLFEGADAGVAEVIRHYALLPSPSGLTLAGPLRAALAPAATSRRLAARLGLTLARVARDSDDLAIAREAVRLLVLGERAGELAALLTAKGDKLLEWGALTEVRGGLALCRRAGDSSLPLGLLEGQLQLALGQPAEAAALISRLSAHPRISRPLRTRCLLTLAHARSEMGEPNEAVRVLDPLLEADSAKSPGDALTEGRLEALKARADALYRQGNLRAAARDFDACAAALVDVFKTKGDGQTRMAQLAAGALSGLANVNFRTGDMAVAARYLTRRKAALQQTDRPAAQAALRINESTMACAQGRLTEASRLCEAAELLYERCGSPSGRALALANRVQVEMLLGRREACEAAYERLIAMGESVSPRLTAAAMKGLSHLRSRSGRAAEAVMLAHRAIDAARAGADAAEECEATIALGEALLASSELASARQQAARANTLARRLGSPYPLCDSLLLLAELELQPCADQPDGKTHESRLKLARELAGEARGVAARASYVLAIAGSDALLGEVALLEGDGAGALQLLERVLSATPPVECPEVRIRCRRVAGEAALAAGDWERAFRIAAPEPAEEAREVWGENAARGAAAKHEGSNCVEACTAARALAALGRHDEAKEWLALARRAGDREARPGPVQARLSLTEAWLALAARAPERALEALGTLPGLGTSELQRREANLFQAAALSMLGESPQAAALLASRLGEGLSTAVDLLALAALERLLRAQGKISRAEQLRQQAGTSSPATRRWLEILGFPCLDSPVPYGRVTGGAPGMVRESRGVDRSLERFDLGVDLCTHRVYTSDAGWVSLAGKSKPLGLLAALGRAPEMTLTKEELFEAVWRRRYNPELHQNSVHNLVGRLRRQLRELGSSREWILTESGAGRYSFAPNLRVAVRDR